MKATPTTLTLAVPSKGRLQENAAAFFGRAGLALTQGRGARDYRGALEGVPGCEIAYLSAGEIAANLAAGEAHLGVTGEDLVREKFADADSRLELLAPLGFGHADVVVAAPRAWIDVATMADLEDVAARLLARTGRPLRVATKYVNLTRRFFALRGVTDYRIVESLGATEGAPAAGTAEIVVDITTTGATLAANGLKVLDDGVILRSQANLVASLRANWDGPAREAARAILARVAAEETARLTREVRVAIAHDRRAAVAAEAAAEFGASAPFGLDGVTLDLRCAKDKAARLADRLVALGAERAVVAALDYAFEAENPLYDRLVNRLG